MWQRPILSICLLTILCFEAPNSTLLPTHDAGHCFCSHRMSSPILRRWHLGHAQASNSRSFCYILDSSHTLQLNLSPMHVTYTLDASECMQTALSLAIAEEACEFEHRDLHWGNLLVHRDSNKTISCRLRSVSQLPTASLSLCLCLSVYVQAPEHLKCQETARVFDGACLSELHKSALAVCPGSASLLRTTVCLSARNMPSSRAFPPAWT